MDPTWLGICGGVYGPQADLTVLDLGCNRVEEIEAVVPLSQLQDLWVREKHARGLSSSGTQAIFVSVVLFSVRLLLLVWLFAFGAAAYAAQRQQTGQPREVPLPAAAPRAGDSLSRAQSPPGQSRAGIQTGSHGLAAP